MIDLEIYSKGDTFIHKLHPSTKIVSLILFFIILIILNNPVYLTVLFVYILVLVIVSKTLNNVLRLRWLILILFLMSFFLWSLMVRSGSKCLELKFISFTCEGIIAGITGGLRIIGMLFVGLLFVFTTRIEEISSGLVTLGLPYRLAFAFTTAIRLLPTFLGAGSIIVEAQESRGHDITGGSVIKRIKNYIPLLIPSFLYGMRNVNQLSIALEVRGFSDTTQRTSLMELKFSFIDFLSITVMLLLFISVITLRFINL